MKAKKTIGLFMFLSFLLTIFIYPGESGKREDRELFPVNKTCAAWYGRKAMIFRPFVGMTGMNCNISVRIVKEGGRLVAEMPLDGFDSGSTGRDKFFRKALKQGERPVLLFESQLNAMAALNGNKLAGTLHIGKKQFPVEFSLEKTGKIVKGKFVANYGHFEMEPHEIGPFGMIARSEDYLELHFQLNKQDL